MKHLFSLTVLSLLAAANVYAVDFQQLLTAGQTAMLQGDITTAKAKFTEANRMDPKNPIVIGYLKQIAIQEQRAPQSPQIEKQLASIIVPQVQFREATFGSALDFLKKKATELSGGKQTVNFVVAPGIDQDGIKVTLNLSNVPLTEALRYVAELANAKVEYQKYAVMIKPANATASTTEKAPGQ